MESLLTTNLSPSPLCLLVLPLMHCSVVQLLYLNPMDSKVLIHPSIQEYPKQLSHHTLLTPDDPLGNPRSLTSEDPQLLTYLSPMNSDDLHLLHL